MKRIFTSRSGVTAQPRRTLLAEAVILISTSRDKKLTMIPAAAGLDPAESLHDLYK